MAHAVTTNGAVVPPLFRWEIQSALSIAVRRKRIAADRALAHLRDLDALELVVDSFIIAASFTVGFDLVERFSLTAYDASYLELAARRSLLLMTRDATLVRAAADLGLLWKT